MPNKPEYLIVHHTGGTDADPRADTSHHTFNTVNTWHRHLWGDSVKSSLGHWCGYHFFIAKDGEVTRARKLTEMGAHTKGYNDRSIGICLAGNFDVTLPTKEQEESLKNLLQELVLELGISASKIVPHRVFSNKSCYGNRLSDDWARKLVDTDVLHCTLKEFSTMSLLEEVADRIRRM